MKRKTKSSELHSALGSCRAVAKSGPVETREIYIPTMYPHKVLATLYHDYNDKFTEYILGGSLDNIPKFWDEMHDHLAHALHPMHSHRLSDFRTHAIPMRLYGDGAPSIGVGKGMGQIV